MKEKVVVLKERINISFICACVCLFVFVWLEQPSIIAKLSHTNTQTFFVFKTFVLLGAEFLLFLALYFASRSFRFYKIVYFVLISFSSIVFDVFYRASGKVIEYQDFLILKQSVANIQDAMSMYWDLIGFAFLRVVFLLVGFIMMPPPPPLEERREILFVLLGFLFS